MSVRVSDDVVQKISRAAFLAALDRPCREHRADPGIPCWTLKADISRGLRLTLCGHRVRPVDGPVSHQ